MIEFGTRVKVHAVAYRLKRYGGDVRTSHRDTIRYGADIFTEPWPGEPVPESTQDLDQARAVAVRRIPFPEPQVGVVAGKTYREEGYVDALKGHGYYDGESFLAAARRVPLYEVVIDRGELGKADLALVHELDLEVT